MDDEQDPGFDTPASPPKKQGAIQYALELDSFKIEPYFIYGPVAQLNRAMHF